MYIVLVVDDNLRVGDRAAIDDTNGALKRKGLVLKIVKGLQEKKSCKESFLMIKRELGYDSPI